MRIGAGGPADLQVYLAGRASPMFYYAYWSLPLFNVLNRLPLPTAFAAWSVLNLLCAWFAVRVFGGKPILVLGSYQMLNILYYGQISGVLAGGLALLWWGILHRKWGAAGFGLLLALTKYPGGADVGPDPHLVRRAALAGFPASADCSTAGRPVDAGCVPPVASGVPGAALNFSVRPPGHHVLEFPGSLVTALLAAGFASAALPSPAPAGPGFTQRVRGALLPAGGPGHPVCLSSWLDSPAGLAGGVVPGLGDGGSPRHCPGAVLVLPRRAPAGVDSILARPTTNP